MDKACINKAYLDGVYTGKAYIDGAYVDRAYTDKASIDKAFCGASCGGYYCSVTCSCPLLGFP